MISVINMLIYIHYRCKMLLKWWYAGLQSDWGCSIVAWFCWLTQAVKQHVVLHLSWDQSATAAQLYGEGAHTNRQVQPQLRACESKQQRESAAETGGWIHTTAGRLSSFCRHGGGATEVSGPGFLIHNNHTCLTNLIFIEYPYIIHRTRSNYWMTHRCNRRQEQKSESRALTKLLFCSEM